MTEVQDWDRPRARRRHRPKPRKPGEFLLAGIDAVLPRLTQDEPVRLAGELRVALARTAAGGYTCEVAKAADGVRLATNLLLTGETDEAEQALRTARTALVTRACPSP